MAQAGTPDFELRIAASPAEVEAAQRLRYAVFVEELGADGPDVDHALAIEADRFDSHAEHLLLVDRGRPPESGVVGTYRLLSGDRAEAAGGFYSAAEFDLAPLLSSGRSLLELGRSCVHADYRGGTAMFELWAGLADYVISRGVDVLFGVASFHGTDVAALAQPLSHLHHAHLAPPELRVAAREPHGRAMDAVPPAGIDRRAALRDIPPLIKAYLRLGGTVGQGAWVDEAFNTTDVCMVLDVARIPEKRRALYARGRVAP